MDQRRWKPGMAALGYLSANIFSGIVVLAYLVGKVDHVLHPIAVGSSIWAIAGVLACAFSRILRLPNAPYLLWLLVGGLVGIGVWALQFTFCASYLAFN
ncbi:hypothetical protein [Mycolicibacterium senegalense]|nr:hypothetical protein [Mycolicibacterium senegalense]